MFDIDKFCFELKIGQEEFGRIIGVQQPVVSNMRHGKRKIKLEHIEKIKEYCARTPEFQNVNVDDFIIPDKPQAATMSPAEVEEPIPDQQGAVIDAIKQGAQVVTDAKTIGATIVSPDVYEGIVEEIKAEMIVPIVPHEVALKAETNIKKFIEDNASELEHFDPRSVTAEVDTAERICTNSMYPTFLPGDVIFIQFLQEKSKITDGGIYYFDTSTRPTMIRLVKLLDDGRLLLKAFNPRYGDIYMRKDEITNIGKISGMYRQTFSDMYAEIEEVRRKKDEQVDSLIEQNIKALQIIEDLIKR